MEQTGLKLDTGCRKILLASSVERNGRRLVAVASGFKTKKTDQKNQWITWGFTNFDTIKISQNKKSITEFDVWLGKNKVVVR